MKIILFVVIFIGVTLGQNTPLQKSNYSRLTSHKELSQFISEVDEKSDIITSEVIAKSVLARELYAVYFTKGEFGEDKSKIKVLIFAQQHGNEQSGKEGSLLLIEELLKPENQYLFEKIDLVVVPQVNPDGAEADKRLNANNMDLNRNHLILTEPETVGLHNLFNKYLFEVTMDVHEYWPFGKTWKKYGFRANNDEQVGTLTNINISHSIRDLSKKEYLPYIKKYLNDRNFSYFEYSPGGPPEADYIRHSTFDINDGRQSLGIQNTFSFIQEGLNGEDSSLQNIKHRSEGQAAGMRGLLEFSYIHKDKIKNLVEAERAKLIAGITNVNTAIQLDHFADGNKLQLPLFSYSSKKDTSITVNNYRPIVKALTETEKPKGYLVPKNLREIVDWADRHSLEYSLYKNESTDILNRYYVADIDSIDFEGDMTVNPKVELKPVNYTMLEGEYIFIPTKQLRGNMIVIALEPKSELGLVTYKKYEHLLKKDTHFPILRIENIKSKQ